MKSDYMGKMRSSIKVTISCDGHVGRLTGQWGSDIRLCLASVAEAVAESKMRGYTITVEEKLIKKEETK